MKTLHGFTEKVITERKKELEEKREDDQDEEVMRMRVILIMMTRGGVKKRWNSIHLYSKHLYSAWPLISSFFYAFLNDDAEMIIMITIIIIDYQSVQLQVMGKKQKLAFLDLLVEASKGGTLLSDYDIREEVRKINHC